MSGLEGGCACGAVRYRLKSGPMFVNCCHCTDCQRQAGSAFAINAVIETDRIEILSGDLSVTALPTDSGRPHDAHRCSACGTTIWSDYGRSEVMSFLRATTLDDRAALAPDAHIFTRSKLPWVALPADTPAFEVFYDLPKQWPPESLARLKALTGG